ncbi:hypothetical protein MPTK1_3g24220 [Marchantia polymorpha subsp. ruderalis]|uniref:Uncharacterized protein n=2 Tax=Marchantia polymorpha TaxID=3197 RepID=A0AAF6B493_MARPO|nr:hypothetical protein MARPO_1035s0002 [Marchantia polymorpha]BBN06827.1 hypothetical protein Mp_3g24220 [Marchantia polymorpha subsp. ruderalis]|eukprot:PTQ26543.1 hypothetical protein MARPO_1035s0002 [Marchantia polymorpha]
MRYGLQLLQLCTGHSVAVEIRNIQMSVMDVYCTLLSDVVAERKRKISFCPEFVIQLAITLIMNSKEE